MGEYLQKFWAFVDDGDDGDWKKLVTIDGDISVLFRRNSTPTNKNAIQKGDVITFTCFLGHCTQSKKKILA